MDELARSLGLPGREIFPAAMPRYPNVWLYIGEDLALRREYAYALRFLERTLDERLGLRDDFYQDVKNPNLWKLLSNPGEGSDFQARIGPLQPWAGGAAGPAHSHQLHARFYASPLIAAGCTTAQPSMAGLRRTCFVVPASVHYEVSTEEESHPYVDGCPVCGITGAYDLPIDRRSQDYCLKIHDPLGAEFLLHGSVRGEQVSRADGQPAAALMRLDVPGGDLEIVYDEHMPGPLGCTRLVRVMIRKRRTP